jgi:3-deoxy-manno-octulosonate cytidylyltransferase (CMP-KDO synthetase)
MTPEELPSGTDRIHFAWKEIGSPQGIIINIQGDEPLIQSPMLDVLCSELSNSSISVGTFIKKINSYEELVNPNNVKAVIDNNHNALYFSRNVIPYFRDKILTTWYKNYIYWKHIGIYGFKSETLDTFVNLPKSSLESVEKLEQLRLLENGIKIKCLETDIQLYGVDTEEDVEIVTAILNNNNSWDAE